MAIAEQPVREPEPLRWSKAQYYQIGEMGLFEGKRVELIEGEIIEMQPIGVAHLRAVNVANKVLSRVFGDAFYVSVQNPFDVGEDAEPQPDILVLAGDPGSLDAVPTTAALLVEVSDTTLNYDRMRKASLYARAGVEDYWIVNLVDNLVEVRRQPQANGYGEVKEYRLGDTIKPLAVIAVADLLPSIE